MTLFKPCLTCGVPGPARYCPAHQPTRSMPKVSPRQRGYDTAWDKLSARARKLQPFCTDCGTRDDLTADHSAEAWERKAQGKPIRLQDVDVVCRTCNARRGDPREHGDEGSKNGLWTPGARHSFSYTPGGIIDGGGDGR